MTQCNACEGNITHGKTCHRCGRRGPLGQGWQMWAMDLEAENVTLRARLSASPTVDRVALRDAIADALGSSAYDCTRVWSAWGYGTMDQDDFRPLVDDEDRLMEIVDAVVATIGIKETP